MLNVNYKLLMKTFLFSLLLFFRFVDFDIELLLASFVDQVPLLVVRDFSFQFLLRIVDLALLVV